MVAREIISIDASLAINRVLPAEPFHSEAVALFSRWASDGVRLVAPPIFESEADSVLRRYVHRRALGAETSRVAQEALDALSVQIVQDSRVRVRAREIAATYNQERVYDSTYAALAELMGCEFWTADRPFYRDVRNGLPFVRFVGASP